MQTTLDLDEDLICEALRLTRNGDLTALIHDGLRALISRVTALRLARLGGTQPDLKPIPRRRSR